MVTPTTLCSIFVFMQMRARVCAHISCCLDEAAGRLLSSVVWRIDVHTLNKGEVDDKKDENFKTIYECFERPKWNDLNNFNKTILLSRISFVIITPLSKNKNFDVKYLWENWPFMIDHGEVPVVKVGSHYIFHDLIIIFAGRMTTFANIWCCIRNNTESACNWS